MARVYVGTWNKYNNGNLAGQWIDLAQCSDYAAFLGKCRNAHKGESDPEYMIQDYEGMPDGLSCGDWLSEADFKDIKAAMAEEAQEGAACEYTIVDYSEKAVAVVGDTRPLAASFKALGGRFNPRLSCGCGWIFPKTKEAELRSLLAGGAVSEGKKAGNGDSSVLTQLKQNYLSYVNQMEENDYWKGVYRKNPDYAVRLSGGWCIIDKPKIENRFCFHDEGPDYDLYRSLMSDNKKLERYFLNENLSSLDTEIENLLNTGEPLYFRPLRQNQVEVLTHRSIYGFYDYLHGDKEPQQITPEDRTTLLSAYNAIRAEFAKRLQSYLKRYGTRKLHTWTYWADA